MAKRLRNERAPAGAGRQGRSREFLIAGIGLTGALLGAIIGLVATIVATSSANNDQTSLQIREMKQAQYSATYKAVALEIQSMGDTLGALQRGDAAGALHDVKAYQNTDQVVGQLSVLPLVANAGVLSAGIDYLKERQTFVGDLYTVALAYSSKSENRQAEIGAAEKQLAALRKSEGNLLAAMRLDLNIPSPS